MILSVREGRERETTSLNEISKGRLRLTEDTKKIIVYECHCALYLQTVSPLLAPESSHAAFPVFPLRKSAVAPSAGTAPR